MEGIGRRQARVQFLISAAIEEQRQPGARIDPEVMFALRAHLEILVQCFFPNDMASALALEPQALRADAFFALARAFFHSRFLPRKPRHSEHSYRSRWARKPARMRATF